MEHEASGGNRRHALNSGIVMAFTLLSRLLGIVKARVIAIQFGSSGIADIINFTFNVPNNFRKLFADGSFNNAHVPVFSSCIANESDRREQSKALLARMQGFQLAVFIPLIVLTWLFRQDIIAFLSDFKDPAHIGLSSNLLVYFMVFLLTISISSVYQGMLQCHGSFLAASAAPLIFSIAVIASVTFLSDSIGPYSMAVGTVTGGMLQAMVTFWRLRSFGYRLTVSFDFHHDRFKEVMKAWVPVTAVSLAAMIGQQVSYYFASMLETGSVTAFSNSVIFWQAPYGVFFTAIATVYLPAFVAASRDVKRLGNLFSQASAHVTALLLPSALILGSLRHETIAVVLQGGLFTADDTIRTAAVLLWYVAGMLFVAWFGLLQRLNYALFSFKRVVVAVMLVVVVDIGLTWALLYAGHGVQALSLANSCAHVVGLLVLAWSSRHLLAGIEAKAFFMRIGRILVANIPLMIASVVLVRYPMAWWRSGSTLANFGRLVICYGAGALLVFVPYRMSGLEFMELLKRRRRS